MTEQTIESNNQSLLRKILHSIGPGLVTACVVIGPGSILTSSKVGATDGFTKIWVVIVAVIFMMSYITMGMKLGIVTQRSVADLISEKFGRWVSLLIGFSIFFIASAFQFGNNLGVYSAFQFGNKSAVNPAIQTVGYSWAWLLLFNGITIVFIFGFKNLYHVLEKLMSFFVAMMLISFAINLFFAKPPLGELASGFIPKFNSEMLSLDLLGLIGTTFVIAAAFYQSYLVQFKGWNTENMKTGLLDARVSSVIMASITLMILSTSASVLRGQELTSVNDIANQLTPLFGEKGRIIFCTGLFSAAFSSFIVNSMIGGFLLSDSLKLGSHPDEKWPKILTAAVLIIGMLVAIYIIKTGIKPLGAIVTAQAVTVIASPLLAGVLLWLTSSEKVMGKHKNGPVLITIGSLGVILLLTMSFNTAVYKVWPSIEKMLG
jgi:manganese transport protein